MFRSNERILASIGFISGLSITGPFSFNIGIEEGLEEGERIRGREAWRSGFIARRKAAINLTT